MLKITKGDVKPLFYKLKQKRENYDNLVSDEKDAIKEILISEQNNRCAYCTCQIRMDCSTIEHYIPRSVDMSLSLDYRNLFAVCDATRNNPRKLKTCDDRRGDTTLHIDPRKQEDIDTISYTHKGVIRSSNPVFEEDLNVVLNLNVERLINNRYNAWKSLANRVAKQKDKQLTKPQIQRYLSKIQSPDDNTPYAGFLIFMLQKRMKRA